MSAARNTIDIVRAAANFPAAHASADYVVWGTPKGARRPCSASTSEPPTPPSSTWRGWWPEPHPRNSSLIYTFLKTSPYRYYLFMAAGAMSAAYGRQAAPLSEVLTPLGRSLLPLLDKGCSDFVANATNKYTLAQITTGDPFKVPAWQKLLKANDPGNSPRPAASRS